MNKKDSLTTFLKRFIPSVANKNLQLNKALWILETTGSKDASDLKAALDTEYRLLFSDKITYQKLLEWDREPITDPILKRQLNVLIRLFKQNAIPEELLKKIAHKEAELLFVYGNFRPELEGKKISDNDIRDLLKKELNPNKRKQAWEASKQIGECLAPKILELVSLRNEAAQSLGHSNYFDLQLELQEVDENWLFTTFNDLATRSDSAYHTVLNEIEQYQSHKFKTPIKELGPWAWNEPFGQEDPVATLELDSLVKECDICEASRKFYLKMGFDVEPIFKRSDMFERQGKNQHAFCINMDRENDVRTLNNVKSSIKWLETVLHEYGHAVYDLGFDKKLPWLLREPPHMIPTEAMALLAGRQAYRTSSLKQLTGNDHDPLLFKKAEQSLLRRQLIFSRWVLVMSHFEKALYTNPKQDLNTLWWKMVEQYQKIQMPKDRKNRCDWAAKYHIALAPVYYFSYLLGEMFASGIEMKLQALNGTIDLASHKAGEFLNHKLFSPGNRCDWSSLAKQVLGHELNADAWLTQFCA